MLINNINVEKRITTFLASFKNPLKGSCRISSKFGRQVELLLFFPLKGSSSRSCLCSVELRGSAVTIGIRHLNDIQEKGPLGSQLEAEASIVCLLIRY
jgi:hypothetical protein